MPGCPYEECPHTKNRVPFEHLGLELGSIAEANVELSFDLVLLKSPTEVVSTLLFDAVLMDVLAEIGFEF